MLLTNLLVLGAALAQPRPHPLAPLQDAVKPAAVSTSREYKVGLTDNLKITITSDAFGSLKAVLKLEVTKAFPSGDADVLETVSNVESTGQLQGPSAPTRTIRLTTYGVLTNDAPAPKDLATWAMFSVVLPNADRLGPKQFVSFERPLPGLGSATVKATAELGQIVGDQVAFSVNGKVLNLFGDGGAPGEVTGALVWDSKAQHYVKGFYHVSGKDAQGKAFTVNFAFERFDPTATKSS
jgi:hypothetical protein